MGQPINAHEYLERFRTNQKMEGHGVGNVWITVPCPFCAAPDFLRYELLDVREAMERDTRCKECDRSCRAIFTQVSGGTRFEIVQTGGPEQPEWLNPKMKRIET